MIFGHFIYFGHFPIEIPIEAEKIYHHGKELSYRENKICSETSEAMRTTWEHAQSDLKTFPNKNHPNFYQDIGPARYCLRSQ